MSRHWTCRSRRLQKACQLGSRQPRNCTPHHTPSRQGMLLVSSLAQPPIHCLSPSRRHHCITGAESRSALDRPQTDADPLVDSKVAHASSSRFAESLPNVCRLRSLSPLRRERVLGKLIADLEAGAASAGLPDVERLWIASVACRRRASLNTTCRAAIPNRPRPLPPFAADDRSPETGSRRFRCDARPPARSRRGWVIAPTTNRDNRRIAIECRSKSPRACMSRATTMLLTGDQGADPLTRARTAPRRPGHRRRTS
jgi:hypothetical protein